MEITPTMILIIVVGIWVLITASRIYRYYTAVPNPALMPFAVDSRVLEIKGPKWAVEQLHNEIGDPRVLGFHGNIDHRTQVEARDYEVPLWYTLGLIWTTKRIEVHVIRLGHLEKALSIAQKWIREGLPITA